MRVTLSASPSRWAKSCSAAVSSSQPFDLAIALNTCWCCCQQTVPLNLGTAVLVNRAEQLGWLTPPGSNGLLQVSDCDGCLSVIGEYRLNRRSWDQSFNPGMGVEASTPRPPCSRRSSGIQDCLVSSGPYVLPVAIPESLISGNLLFFRLSRFQYGVVNFSATQEVTPGLPVAASGNGLSRLPGCRSVQVIPKCDQCQAPSDRTLPISGLLSTFFRLLFWLLFSSVSNYPFCWFPTASQEKYPGQGHQIVTVTGNQQLRTLLSYIALLL